MDTLVDYLLANNLTISCMESLTGGLFGARLTSFSGISKIFCGGIIAYSDEAKVNIGQVSSQIISEYGAISREAAVSMAEQCQQLFKTNIAVSFTGNAGPTAQEGKPVGLVYSCLSINASVYVYEDLLSGTRDAIREQIINLMIVRMKENLGV
ncbi:MAG: nicotinamide-nucleotide amidohydrolase family protein [Erysipelotrichaceae bacterium]|nr:nicotinamide-nucleotide amidohydrolase family protein [Erysipelotrichaceae bacterium]